MAAGVYLHIPFCKSRCSYCDFATDVYRNSETVERYVSALCSEIGQFGKSRDQANNSHYADDGKIVTHDIHPSSLIPHPSIDTVYFGGGTPSLLSAKQVEKILQKIETQFEIAGEAEITMEMNPATVKIETLRDYRSLGVNRASFGVQTFNDHDLKLLARGHDANDARDTFELLRRTGFDNVSFDLIAGLPGQSLKDWDANLSEAMALSPEHLSLYLLEIHEGSPLAEQVRSGRRPTPDEDLAAEMYELMQDSLEAAGYEQYEISNFSRPGFASRHNSKYWRLDPVFGFGVSAHSFDGHERYSNERDTARYAKLIEDSASAEVGREIIDRTSEFLFLGLRLNEGIDLSEFQNRFNIDIKQEYSADLDRLKQAELIEVTDGRLRLTKKGMLFSNEVFAVFV